MQTPRHDLSAAVDDEVGRLHRGGPEGRWGSLGLWPAPSYAQACEALATRVGQAAHLRPGCRVLSVACGEGEELRLWAQAFGASVVVGVERDVERAQAARHLQPGSVHIGSGTTLHSLGGDLTPGSFDAVLCVDAAYHLHPRSAFLHGAWTLLRPGGRLAYTDLLLDPGPRRRGPTALLRAAARLCGLRAEDLCSAEAQLQRLQNAGWTESRVERLDEAVLGGFARHVRAQAVAQGYRLWQAAWRRPALTAALIAPCRAAGLGYALITARRPGATALEAMSGAAASSRSTTA